MRESSGSGYILTKIKSLAKKVNLERRYEVNITAFHPRVEQSSLSSTRFF